MGTVKNGLLVLLTLALVAFGTLLPYGTAKIQDRRLESANDTRELSQIQLLIQQDMNAAQMLSILGGDYTKMTWDSETNLSAEGALTEAWNVVEIMAAEGLLPKNAYLHDLRVWDGSINAFLVISNGENREALILWELSWESIVEDAVYTIWIDDATGMLCGINRTENGVYAPAVVEYMDILVEYADQWINFLCDYYGFTELDEEIKTKEVVDGEFLDTFTLTLTFESIEDAQSMCTVKLTFQGANISFIC